jgi:hypothetical protein
VNRKRVLRVMRERGLLVGSHRLRARRKKEWGRVEAVEPNQIWQIRPYPQPALQWHQFLDVFVDVFSPERLLGRRRASTFCKAPFKNPPP